MNSLPLSWSYVNEPTSRTKIIRNWRTEWLAFQNLPTNNITDVREIQDTNAKNFIIRGCNSNTSKVLEQKGFSSLLVGYEAIIDLSDNPFTKKSLRELIKRGNKYGSVTKLRFSIKNRDKLEIFQKQATHGQKPQLKNLFQMSFEENNFLYAFVDENKNWLGAILVSQNSEDKLHTELLLRKKNAPVGIMEKLVEAVFLDSEKMGFKKLSLGEVPFIKDIYKNGNSKSKILYIMGNLLNFSYNHKGLYQFKNKFNPSWEKVYICASKKVTFYNLFFILIHSNFHRLVMHNIIYTIKKIIYSFYREKYLVKLDFNKT